MTDQLPPLPPYLYGRECSLNERVWSLEAVRAYAEAAIAAEREACAKVCEGRAGSMSMFGSVADARSQNYAVRGCASAIRSRAALKESP